MFMKNCLSKKRFVTTTLVLLATFGLKCMAENPIIQTKYTADPAPVVYHDTVFLYTGHDEDDAKGFKMFNWQLYTSTDMANWTDHGAVASLKMFSWAAENGAWAAQCVTRNGKYYLYCPVAKKKGSMAIGVAVSNSPYGPFTDTLGKPLIDGNSTGDFDPTVFIDDDGQAYLYWGNPNCFYVKLNKDMISYSGSIVKIDSKPANYQEGPWFYKRKGHYYLAYASTCCPEAIGYAMSDSPTGPWIYKGMIMDPKQVSSGNHPGIIDYKGNSYVFGFNYALLWAKFTTHYERRSICVEKMTYNPDGTIQKLPFWIPSGTMQLGTLNPFIRNEAECIAWESDVKTEKNDVTGVYVTDIDNGDYIKVKGVNFKSGATLFKANTASIVPGGKIEIHTDSVAGPLIGTCLVENTGDRLKWQTNRCVLRKTKGVHDIYLVFTGGEGKLFNFDWWQFYKH
jgi:arabinoxylan arabinofuranohydrolase